MVECHHVGPRQRRPDGGSGTDHLGQWFPLIGLPGNLRKAPNTWLKPNTGHVEEPKPAFIHDDNFDSGKLNPHWQWNHVPDDAKWSLTERPGVLRLHSLMASNFWAARNSLC